MEVSARLAPASMLSTGRDGTLTANDFAGITAAGNDRRIASGRLGAIGAAVRNTNAAVVDYCHIR
ncbi:MAG: hypothetical protein JSU63_03780 [Phycisphaerales bacterium]|nr:MAG: hypothetical protein JSU63_03780 [Phycisphaerales bacterium]